MKRMHLFIAFVIVAGIIEAFWFYPLLPERMAVHFGSGGIADGWGPKDGFFKEMGIAFGMFAALFGALPFLLPLIPDSMINLPNKDYWLAPERRKETLDRLANQMLFVGSLAILLLEGILFLCFQANKSEKPALDPALLWGMIGGFTAITIVWTIAMIRGFRRPEI